MKKITEFMREWFGGLIFWLYAGCLIYVTSASNDKQYQGPIYYFVLKFLLISFVVFMFYSLAMNAKYLTEEMTKVAEKNRNTG